LATLTMVASVALIALVGVVLLGLPLGAAVVLGAVLAPTDPVLASEVQVANPRDQDRVRFSLTGEAALNDGTAFPFVMLGLGLLGLHELGPGGLRWLAVDVVWAATVGLALGAALGTGIGRLVIWLRARSREPIGLEDFLALGLIALAYGSALLVHAYGFRPSSRPAWRCAGSSAGPPPPPNRTSRNWRTGSSAPRPKKPLPTPRRRRSSWRGHSSTSTSSWSGSPRSCSWCWSAAC
jgi:hypothetical protein